MVMTRQNAMRCGISHRGSLNYYLLFIITLYTRNKHKDTNNENINTKVKQSYVQAPKECYCGI